MHQYLLKHNKYICILSIAVITLLYITISMITIFSMYIVHVHLGSGHNSYQGHVYNSGEFWRVLGCPHARCHWKHNIVDTFTHHFCTSRHGWTSFLYIRESERQHSSSVQYIAFPLILVGTTSLYKLYHYSSQQKNKVRDKPALLCFMLCNNTDTQPQFQRRRWSLCIARGLP